MLHRNLGITSVAAFPGGTYHRQLALENFPEVEVEVKTLTGKCEPPPPRCSFARHLVGKMAIQAAHLLITKHQPVDTHLKTNGLEPLKNNFLKRTIIRIRTSKNLESYQPELDHECQQLPPKYGDHQIFFLPCFVFAVLSLVVFRRFVSSPSKPYLVGAQPPPYCSSVHHKARPSDKSSHQLFHSLFCEAGIFCIYGSVQAWQKFAVQKLIKNSESNKLLVGGRLGMFEGYTPEN